MARKKKNVKQAPEEIQETTMEEPGYCIGHFDKKDKACDICEIQDECKRLTSEIQNGKGEEDEDDEKEK